MNYTVTITFPSESQDEAHHLFEAFRRCIADHVPYHAVLSGPVQMNIVVVNEQGKKR